MRPESDELDRFKKRKTGQAVKPTAKPVSGAPVAVAKARPSLAWIALVLILACVCGALAWGYVLQEQRISNLDRDLNDAIGFISQSKLLIARLEGELSETGEELEQSGSAAAKKLAFLDSEMRKLWGVSNDRNKKAIAGNTEALDKLERQIASVQSGLDKRMGSMVKSLDALEASYQKVNSSLKTLDSKISLTSGEMAITRDSISEELAAMKAGIGDVGSLKEQIAENKKAIAAIDSSRKQVNARLVDLGRQVNELRLNANSVP